VIARLLIGISLCVASAAFAADDHGHDHGDGPAAGNPNGPSRLPDGSVFLPKPAQHQLGIRTQVGRLEALARTVELSGRVAMDPNAGGKVQATAAGRIEPGPRGLPALGQAVRKGEVLAYVMPSSAPIERSNQRAQLAELQAARALAEKRAVRLRELSDTVPRKEIEAAEAELAGLHARAAAVGGGLTGREALVAPVGGVIASAHVVAGQVVDARELVYEVVDLSRLSIEALAFDAALGANVGSAVLAVGSDRVPLQFVGAARTLREQALPLSFRAQGAALSKLAVSQPVTVFVQTKATLQGIAVPVAALMKSPANQTIVWVKSGPERFEPRVVSVEPLDGIHMAVTAGLTAGERVATQGATLINQVR
jgi:membrane fusion protein, heavy metal efflux system